jgi:hypothetical protein
MRNLERLSAMHEEYYCHHHAGGNIKDPGTWKMEPMGSNVGKCSGCNRPKVVEIYMCPRCNREIYVIREFLPLLGMENK